MSYPTKFTPLADKEAVLKAYKGKKVADLPTPSYLINQKRFAVNCAKMFENSANLKADFRAHIKTHKTVEGTRLQLGEESSVKTTKIVVSTLLEAWAVIPLVKEKLIDDILFSLPVVKSRLPELADLANHVPHLRLMLDNAEQLDLLTEYSEQHPETKKWSIFIKINMGTDRAGLINDSEYLEETLRKVLTNQKVKNVVEVYGFYCHAGHSYASDSVNAAKSFLLQEITHANKAAKYALEFDPSLKLQLSVGATPTAHSSHELSIQELETAVGEKLSGQLELHAGNYPCCDLQQVSTGCVTLDDVSISLLAEVCSTYPGRGKKGPGEQLVNAGVIALCREFGPLPGHGRVVEPKGFENWIVGRLSQEHGILVPLDTEKPTKFIPLGTKVKIVPQHSCITAAAHPWFYIIDDNDNVVDIWVPYRGW
ncbi:putative serine dehydratase domain-containing protein [Scheffersomyces xylosifermentans]|uniref:putative serine dehydratase domain-containing protein n=1 Tax=Scheffersomyces xylosifermentans TaxID=1304137 RepID=UPI00315CEACF